MTDCGSGAPVEETRSGLIKSEENANLTSATRDASSASSKEGSQNGQCCKGRIILQ